MSLNPVYRYADADQRVADPSATTLVVEDEAMIAWMLECLLTDMGLTDVRLASNGAEAIAAAQAAMPALIVSDINLASQPDGVETARRIASAGDRPPPVIFVSAYADAATRARIEDAVPGAQVLRKPVVPAELEAAIGRVLGS